MSVEDTDGNDGSVDSRLLDDAKEIIDGRSDTHGDAENTHGRIARYWTLYLEEEGKLIEPLSDGDAAELMSLLKLARSQDGAFNEDDYRDRLAYVDFAANFKDE